MAVFTKKLKKHIFVHPGDRHKLQTAIKIALLKDRKKYSDSLEGALLDVNTIQMIGDRHLIVNGYISMEVLADFEVFAPTVGMVLEGVINKVHRGHYGCLVMDLFNASLSLSQDMNTVPKEGDTCSFMVTKLFVDGDLLFMRGQMTSITPADSSVDIKSELETLPFPALTDTSIKFEPEDESMSGNNKSPKKKHKKSKEDLQNPSTPDYNGNNITVKSEPVEDSISEPNNDSANKKHKKKSKKDRLDMSTDNGVSLDSSVKSEQEDSSMVESPKDKSKKKHKKKSKEIKMEDGSGDNLNNDLHKKHRKRHRSDEEETETKLDMKPKIGIDVPSYSPSGDIISPLKIKQEPGTIVKKVKKSKHKD